MRPGARTQLGLSAAVEHAVRAGHRQQCGTSATIRSPDRVTGAGVSLVESRECDHQRQTGGGGMRRVAPASAVVGALAFVFAVVGAGLVQNVAAAAAEPSNVVLEFDFSTPLTSDKAHRNQFAQALNDLADRVNEPETTAKLVAGDTTVSLIQFATKAADVKSCVDLKLLNDPEAVTHFAACLHEVARQYGKGGSPQLTKAIGVDTNYVAALQQAGLHLPPEASRPVIIFFTDGRHDVKGVPFAAVLTERD